MAVYTKEGEATRHGSWGERESKLGLYLGGNARDDRRDAVRRKGGASRCSGEKERRCEAEDAAFFTRKTRICPLLGKNRQYLREKAGLVRGEGWKSRRGAG